jgi:hypothetical protein
MPIPPLREEKETVAGDTQGVPLATMRELVRHWQTDYDWQKIEARLNAGCSLLADCPESQKRSCRWGPRTSALNFLKKRAISSVGDILHALAPPHSQFGFALL